MVTAAKPFVCCWCWCTNMAEDPRNFNELDEDERRKILGPIVKEIFKNEASLVSPANNSFNGITWAITGLVIAVVVGLIIYVGIQKKWCTRDHITLARRADKAQDKACKDSFRDVPLDD